jgi:hypothetical protein
MNCGIFYGLEMADQPEVTNYSFFDSEMDLSPYNKNFDLDKNFITA